MALEIIEKSTPNASDAICFPTDYFGIKLDIINIMALLQSIGLIFLIWVSVIKPWKK